MHVTELARNLKVDADALLHFLRDMRVQVTDVDSEMAEADVARVLARVERERRSGKKSVTEALQAAMKEVKAPVRRRRRREPEPEPVVEEDQDTVASADTDSAVEEAGAAEDQPAEVDADDGVDTVIDVDTAAAVDTKVAAKTDEVQADLEVDSIVAETPDPEAETVDPEVQAIDLGEEDDATGSAAIEEAKVTAAEAVEAQVESGDEGDATPSTESVARPKPVRSVVPADAPPRRVLKPTPAASAAPGGTVRIQAEGYTADGRRKAGPKKKGKRRGEVDRDAVQSNIQRVMAQLRGGGSKKRRRKGRGIEEREAREQQEEQQREDEERELKTVKVNEFLTVAELSELIDVSANQLVGAAFKNLGLMVTINQRLDFDQLELLLEEFGFVAEQEEEYEVTEIEEVVDAPEDLRPRPPVVTVMGHVDHGKTLLLDAIRSTNVVAGESGGITQHIGAYHVELDDERSVTFLDTPGHAAFTAMRARGAEVTDLVVLVVAADDAVMPQTIEAISHAKNAGVPLVVAINKIDLPSADAQKVKQGLLQHEVILEEFGGDVLHAEVSAKSGQGIDDLLERILLQAELLELTGNPDRDARGAVVEARLDVGKGPVVTVLVSNGTLKVGDAFICGLCDGRVRALLDERGHAVKSAGPGIPVQILGSSGVPQAGDTLQVMDAVRASEIATTRQRLEREKKLRVRTKGRHLGDFSKLLQEGATDTLAIMVKGDVDGSVQALADALEHLGTSEVKVDIVHRGVGAVNESDILLAEATGAIVLGFQVRPDTNARRMAERSDVEIRSYEVIYEAVDEIRSALEGMLSPERIEEVLGAAKVKELFKITGLGTIGGSEVIEGVIRREGHVRVVRDGRTVYDGDISSLKRFKDDAKEVREGLECGIGVANFNDLKVGDVFECYRVEEVARTLAQSAKADA